MFHFKCSFTIHSRMGNYLQMWIKPFGPESEPEACVVIVTHKGSWRPTPAQPHGETINLYCMCDSLLTPHISMTSSSSKHTNMLTVLTAKRDAYRRLAVVLFMHFNSRSWLSFTVAHCLTVNSFRNTNSAVLLVSSGTQCWPKRMIHIMFYTLSLHTSAATYLFFISKLDAHALQNGTWMDMPLLFTCLVSWGHVGYDMPS